MTNKTTTVAQKMITCDERCKLIDYLDNNNIEHEEDYSRILEIIVNNEYVDKLQLCTCEFTGNDNTIIRHYLNLSLKGTSHEDCNYYKHLKSISTLLLSLDEMIDVIRELNIVQY